MEENKTNKTVEIILSAVAVLLGAAIVFFIVKGNIAAAGAAAGLVIIDSCALLVKTRGGSDMVTLFKKRDREDWEQICKALQEADIKGVRSGHYLQETVMGGGCGAKLDPRDFGQQGRIDREIYWVEVPGRIEAEAREALRRSGLVPEVEENVLLDAALRKKQMDTTQF